MNTILPHNCYIYLLYFLYFNYNEKEFHRVCFKEPLENSPISKIHKPNEVRSGVPDGK